MSDLVGFLTARLDEDEEVALEAAGRDASRRNWMRKYISCVETANGDLIVYGEGTPTSAAADHIARHDPARALREIAAKRAIAEAHDPVRDPCDAHDASLRTIPCDTLLWLAKVYAGHPDHREDWSS